jgi:AraC family transcriptional regulator
VSETLSAIGEALAFIDTHLQEEISVADMAAAAGYSLYHFTRTFNRCVHHTPYDYLMRRRLSEAARRLAGGRVRITDLALEYRFHNIETFSRGFKRMFGLQPKQYREAKSLNPQQLLKACSPAQLLNIQRGDFLHPELRELPGLRLAGYMLRLREGPSPLPELWAALREEADCSNGVYGVSFYPRDWTRNGAFYLAAVALSGRQPLPPTFVSRDFPAGKYACFKHPGPAEGLGLTRDYVYQSWLPRSGQRPSAPLDIEWHDGEAWRLCLPV